MTADLYAKRTLGKCGQPLLGRRDLHSFEKGEIGRAFAATISSTLPLLT
jgi:hypothetical protein